MRIIKVGSAGGNDVIINDPNVERTHCQIIQDDYGNFRLINISLNGTFVNGIKRQGEIILNVADIVMVGNTVLSWQSYFPSFGQRPVKQPPLNKPNSYMVWAILATIFCCLPFGIVSIVYASKVDSLWYAGQYVAANDAASKARLWFWLSVGTSAIASIIYLFCLVLMF